MSGDPRLCSSLVSDGFEDEPKNKKTPLNAISSDFELGFARLKRFFAVLEPLAAVGSPKLRAGLDQTVAFLESHRDRYLLLETIELDCMVASGKADLRTCVEKGINACVQVGSAIDALPDDVTAAGKCLKEAAKQMHESSFAVFYGLRLDDDYDNTSDRKTVFPLGLEWGEVLFFELWNRAQFDAKHNG
jgi:hypothetical protein